MEKPKKRKIKIDFNIKKPSMIEAIQLEEMYRWEEIFLSRKGKKNSLIGYG